MEFAKTTANAVNDSSLGPRPPGGFSFWDLKAKTMVPIVIFVGAGLGGVARYAISQWVQLRTGAEFPYGTLLVNVTGSLVLAFLYATLEGTPAAPEWRAFLGIGVIGGYTTFSTFSYETVRLLQDGEWGRAALYVTASVVLSVAAAIAGFGLAPALLRRG
jgi:CrcB protein